MSRQRKFKKLRKEGYAFVDFDGWNVCRRGHRFRRDFDSLESAVDWAWDHWQVELIAGV